MEEKIPEQIQDPVSQPLGFKPKLPKWIIVLISVLILIIVSGIAAYLYKTSISPQNTQKAIEPTVIPTQTLNPTTNWKTYTNTKYNYTVDYPSDWSVSESDSQNGASFNPIDKPGYPNTSSAISVSTGKTLGNYVDSTLEEYAKIAGKEIQNYNSLASLKKITTTNGAVGYETTWMVQPMTVMGHPPTAGESESLPITYFEIPSNKTSLVRVTLDRKEDLATYEKMLTTIKIMTPLTPTPTVDEAAVLQYVIKKYIALKHNSNENSLTINVSKIEGNYAQGGVSDEGGGGMWFAVKEDGVWKLVWDGNGIIECSTFTLYPNFPTSMISECYDTAKQDVVKR